MTCVVKIFCLNPFIVYFVVLVYVLKTVEENIQSGTEAFGGPAGLGKSKNEVNCIREAKSQYTNKVCKENSKTKNIFYLCLTCVVKISRRKFNDIKLFLLYSFCFFIFFKD